MDKEKLKDFRHKAQVALSFLNGTMRSTETAFDIIRKGNKTIGASIDVAANCNLRCQHCYLYEKDHVEEQLNDKQFLNHLDQFRRENPTVVVCTWVGGEPLYRRELVREGVKRFPWNWVITNGTILINGKWTNNTAFFVSIDGPKEIHDQIRQPAWKVLRKEVPVHESSYSVYERAKANTQRATAPVAVHTVINKINKDAVPDLVTEWRDETPVTGFAFSLHTPMRTERGVEMSGSDKALFLPEDERGQVVEMLLSLKAQHGDFILPGKRQLEALLPENQQAVFGYRNCVMRDKVHSLDAKFNRKNPCVMGDMDCNNCGCVIPTILGTGGTLPLLWRQHTNMLR